MLAGFMQYQTPGLRLWWLQQVKADTSVLLCRLASGTGRSHRALRMRTMS